MPHLREHGFETPGDEPLAGASSRERAARDRSVASSARIRELSSDGARALAQAHAVDAVACDSRDDFRRACA